MFLTIKRQTGGYSNALPFTGTYTVLIDPSNSATGTVTLTLGESSPDTTYGIDVGGTTKTITTASSSQNALVSFKGYPGQRLSLRAANATVSGQLQVFGPDWAQVASLVLSTNNNDPNTRFIDTFSLPIPGTYTVVVWLGGSGGGTRSVDLTLYDVPADVTNPISFGGPPVTGNLTVPGQDALFTFNGTAGQRVSFSLPGTAAAYGWWEIVDLFWPSISNEGGFIEPVTLATAGIYTLKFDGDYIVGNMTATLYNVPADFSGSVIVNGSATNLSTTPGQNANVTFNGTGGQLVTVRVSGNTMNQVTVTLLNSNNSTLAATTSSSTSFNLTQITLPANGTYRININPSGANAGNISVSVTNP